MTYLKLSAFASLLPRKKILRGKYEKIVESFFKLFLINTNTIIFRLFYIYKYHIFSYIKINITYKDIKLKKKNKMTTTKIYNSIDKFYAQVTKHYSQKIITKINIYYNLKNINIY